MKYGIWLNKEFRFMVQDQSIMKPEYRQDQPMPVVFETKAKALRCAKIGLSVLWKTGQISVREFQS